MIILRWVRGGEYISNYRSIWSNRSSYWLPNKHSYSIRSLHSATQCLQKTIPKNKKQDQNQTKRPLKIEHKSSWDLPQLSYVKPKLSAPVEEEQRSPKDKVPKMDRFELVNSIKPLTRHKSLKELFKDPKVPEWKKQKEALKNKFGDQGWNPMRKISREEMKSVKFLKAQNPNINNTQLADYFKVSPESIRRILKSKWEPKSLEEDEALYERWKRRGEKIKEMMNNNSHNQKSNFNKQAYNFNKQTSNYRSSKPSSDLKFVSEEEKPKVFSKQKKYLSKRQIKIQKRTKKPKSYFE
ncbi:Rrg9 protein [Saccharomycopsis crataegensis]|uniref:Required for respiratory growth protein 9, mitochondrial n=1 Tax=Saccharomycopsis crataegensis TaxID=43959 RepID=A0AAV5QT40_9ASCO|nr:Rrg9 protein [Saccharomycopsis crataegensis]